MHYQIKNKYVRTVLLAIMVAGVSAGCSSSSGEHEKEKSVVAVAPGIETFPAAKGILSSSITMPGELVSYQQVDLYARETSFVKKLFVDVGTEVKTGQILATLEAPELASRLAGAESRWKSVEATYIASKASYDRLVETSKTPGTISPNELDQALARMNSDHAQLQAARASYTEATNTQDYLTIRAPFSGVISARNVNPGAYVGPSGRGSERPLFTLQEQKHLRLVVSVPESYSAYLSKEDEVTFLIKALPTEKFSAKVTRMAGALDAKLRSQRVEMDVMNETDKLLPGMIAQVKIPMANRDSAFIVPKSAIVNTQENVFVIKIENDTARWVNVQTGHSAAGQTEVYGELRIGDAIIKSATEEIRNGTFVKNK